MVPFNNPIGRKVLPKRHAGSQMDSPREQDATGKQWEMSQTTDTQVGILLVSLQRVQNELGKLRRRVLGGGATQSSSGMVFKGQYNPTKSYESQNVVIYTSQGGSAGTYVALQKVIAGKAPDQGAPNWVALPAPAPGQWD